MTSPFISVGAHNDQRTIDLGLTKLMRRPQTTQCTVSADNCPDLADKRRTNEMVFPSLIPKAAAIENQMQSSPGQIYRLLRFYSWSGLEIDYE